LIHCSPQVILLAVDFDEDFIDVDCVTAASGLSLQSSGVQSRKLDAPETDRFRSDDNVSLAKKIFNIAVTWTKSVLEPDRLRDDIRWESVAFISIHPSILAILGH
jgi:hypothetical protein